MSKYGIGQPVLRFEDPRLLRGQGRFVNDVNLHGQAHAVFVRSPHAHAKIRSMPLLLNTLRQFSMHLLKLRSLIQQTL